eukprot:jgi/Galph1/2027/GphlegSOOS_G704.1
MGKTKESTKNTDKKKLKTCNFVKARHILCEKQGKILEAWKILQTEYFDQGNKVPSSKFAELATRFSECSSAKRGGDLGWFPRGKMEPKFQEVAFSTVEGEVSEPFKGANGWHIIFVEGRRA